MTRQYFLTVNAGKALIAMGVAAREDVRAAMAGGTVVIVAGSTNFFVAKALAGGQADGLSSRRFFRGLTIPPGVSAPVAGEFAGDMVLEKGEYLPGRTVFDVCDALGEGDVILKGGNALHLPTSQAGVLIGHSQAGTVDAVFRASAGRRVRVICPIGLEKRADRPIHELCALLNAPGASGLRMAPNPGETFCELDAIALLTGAKAELAAAGGVLGAEGGVYVAVTGDGEMMRAMDALYDGVRRSAEW